MVYGRFHTKDPWKSVLGLSQGSVCVELVCLWVLKREEVSNSISFNRLLSLAHLDDCYKLNTNKYMRGSVCQFIVPLIYTIETDLTKVARQFDS